MIGLALVIIIIVLALTAPLFIDYDTQVISQNIANRLQRPSAEHWFGTWGAIFSAAFCMAPVSHC